MSRLLQYKVLMIILIMKPETIPPKNPSQLFFGDTLGFILCFPKALPIKYAPVSEPYVAKTMVHKYLWLAMISPIEI